MITPNDHLQELAKWCYRCLPYYVEGGFCFFGVVKRNLIDDNENWLIANGCFNGDWPKKIQVAFNCLSDANWYD
jgi:hypothetical protein